MATSIRNAQIIVIDDDEEDYIEMEDSHSDDSEDDPTYTYVLDKARSHLSHLSLKTRDYAITEMDVAVDDDDDDDDDDEVSHTEEISAPTLGMKNTKDLEEIQKIVECGQVEKLKVDQCKVYLRKHGLRLTGKKDILIQRIKEHLEILNGGEKKFPPSSFVLNCKGDACMGDIVKFEQTVYEGYSIVSRSAVGPPCGKRTVAGRIVKESYGAAKQQHTFTVEVLWSKGDKPLPPLHPLLIKGRNLYKLNTLRQRWNDEAERRRVLNEKHNRGTVARSNREARIQEKESRKARKDPRIIPKEGQHSRQEQNHRHATDHLTLTSKNQGSKAHKQHSTAKMTQQQQTNPEQNLKVAMEFKENSYHPFQQNKPEMLASRVCLGYKDQNTVLSRLGPPPKLQHNIHAKSNLESHFGFPDNFRQHPRHQQNSFQQRIPITKHGFCSFSRQHESNSTSLHNFGRNHQEKTRQLCRHYPQGRCYYGMNCKFLHVSNRNQC